MPRKKDLITIRIPLIYKRADISAQRKSDTAKIERALFLEKITAHKLII